MKKITIITGHYGSGKSEFSINLALNKKVDMLIDLDIVNPYFRSRELMPLLKENNIELVSSSLENSLGSDLPFISKDAFLPFSNNNIKAIYDLGGDNVGAKLLKQFNITQEDVDFLLCINIYRERSQTAEQIFNLIKEIETSSGVKVTGLINNSNFLRDTTFDDIKLGEEEIKKLYNTTNLKIKYTGVYENINLQNHDFEGELIPLKLYLRKKWL